MGIQLCPFPKLTPAAETNKRKFGFEVGKSEKSKQPPRRGCFDPVYRIIYYKICFPGRCLLLYGFASQLPAMGTSPGMPNANTMSAKPTVLELRR